MRSLFLALLLLFTSCNKDEAAETICANSKELFSTWTLDSNGTVYIMGGGQYNQTMQVLFGDGPCDDDRGDFSLYVTPEGRMGFGNCADTVLLDAGDWVMSCNVLTITYDSDGSVDVLR